MGELGKYVLYFLLGGTIVSVSTYLGSQGKSFLAAFVSTFPAITGATFVLIYLNGGNDAIISYAKKLTVVCPTLGGLRRFYDCRSPTFWLLAHYDRFTHIVFRLRRDGEARTEINPLSDWL